jgi:hypothetical protein
MMAALRISRSMFLGSSFSRMIGTCESISIEGRM